ncbi:ankyrin repeat domain-containing protein [Pectobacterium parmentieri]|uniref:hypothetical protein n=1 Tax=Pectobacterium TaxID=122277 RepID=UPI00201B4263|nr:MULTISPECIES: hypothetical protein [Pectobacterium]MCL6354360.1 ankyrin repeat domain-containing protein [Pectobacterium parmentieri]MCL6398376.1 ankyrin repeat domain-containing protein [Pectobacterium carotovorum subsp. carotovorum]
MDNKFNSIADIFSEMIRGFGNPSNTNKLGQNLIFKEYVWNPRDLKTLLEQGFNINQKDNHGKTPIFYCKNYLKFGLLFVNGADLDHVDNNNRNLLFFENIMENIKLMLTLDINFNIIDSAGNNFLSYAPFHQYPELFYDQLSKFSGNSANIFQLYEKSEEALKLLEKESIKFTLSPKIILNYDPKKEKHTITSLLSYLKDKTEKSQINKIRFIYSPSDDSPAQIYTLHQLSNII